MGEYSSSVCRVHVQVRTYPTYNCCRYLSQGRKGFRQPFSLGNTNLPSYICTYLVIGDRRRSSNQGPQASVGNSEQSARWKVDVDRRMDLAGLAVRYIHTYIRIFNYIAMMYLRSYPHCPSTQSVPSHSPDKNSKTRLIRKQPNAAKSGRRGKSNPNQTIKRCMCSILLACGCNSVAWPDQRSVISVARSGTTQ